LPYVASVLQARSARVPPGGTLESPPHLERLDVFRIGVVVLFVQIGAFSSEAQHPCGFVAGAGCSSTGPTLRAHPRQYIDTPDRRPRNTVPAFALRFVGQETLPSRLSEFDREQFFELSSADVTAIRAEFRSDLLPIGRAVEG
jgi:hypothetical protein